MPERSPEPWWLRVDQTFNHDMLVKAKWMKINFMICNLYSLLQIAISLSATTVISIMVWTMPPVSRKLIEVYSELSSKNDIEIVFVSADRDDEAFNGYFSKMPWLAIPLSETGEKLNELFGVEGIPCLVIIDGSGKVLSDDGVSIISEYGAGAYPFTPERIKELKEEEEKAKKEQTLNTVLVSGSRDFLISNDGTQDKSCRKLIKYFELSALPTLVILGPDGKTLHPNAAEFMEEYGIQTYPFTAEKLAELEEIKKAKLEAQTLESILVEGDRDFVLGKDGKTVSQLVGKNTHWCPPCRAFLLKLIEAYHDIKAKDNGFEVIFISSDRDESSFQEYFSTMPWLALPFGDDRKISLSCTFKIHGIPTVIALGPSGKTVTKDARELMMIHGANAYPFTIDRLKEIEVENEEQVKGCPEKIQDSAHIEHELVLSRRMPYICDKCDKEGKVRSYYCGEWDFDLHPKCASLDREMKVQKLTTVRIERKDGPVMVKSVTNLRVVFRSYLEINVLCERVIVIYHLLCYGTYV
ncbi:hypothetical protein IFM89_003950 [Coptis chinensis]|uniref:protein-disulfide reductase n=1 Tax=Coptis chinensis TaxID=261450 RepID=A0A835H459_9MAGN|nr:hypothetical protein IFM89_003950 [Coptis chinensis]